MGRVAGAMALAAVVVEEVEGVVVCGGGARF